MRAQALALENLATVFALPGGDQWPWLACLIMHDRLLCAIANVDIDCLADARPTASRAPTGMAAECANGAGLRQPFNDMLLLAGIDSLDQGAQYSDHLRLDSARR
jgi:hypothetical protein